MCSLGFSFLPSPLTCDFICTVSGFQNILTRRGVDEWKEIL